VNDSTSVFIEQPDTSRSVEFTQLPSQNLKLYLGEPVEVYGNIDAKTKTVTADRLLLYIPLPHAVAGSALIDAILPLPAGAAPTDRLVRADGYPILIPAAAKSTFAKPLSSPSDIRENVWIDFNGIQRPDGIVVADKVSFRQNILSRGDEELQATWDYDPSAVDPASHQNSLDKWFRGVDPSKFPPYKDEAAQKRITAIGQRIAPRFEANLPNEEKTRINFSFYLLDAPKWRDAVALPNGIVLVPYSLTQRLSDDTKLAATLADKVAWLIEKQPLILPKSVADVGIDWSEVAAEVVVPAAGLVSSARDRYKKDKSRVLAEQRDRVSLSLLRDAGYNLQQAPQTWWLLSSKQPRDVSEIHMPDRAGYLYQFLGDTWPSDSATSAMPPVFHPAAPR